MYSFYCRMYCWSSFLVFLYHTFSLEPEPANKKPGAGQKWTGSATLVRTRGQLESISKGDKSMEEELDETLLDEDSESETKISKMETDQDGAKSTGNIGDLNDVYKERTPVKPG